MNYRLFSFIILLLLLAACGANTVKIKNKREGQQKPTFKLEQSETKKIVLDSASSPKPLRVQLIEDSTGTRYFTFLNSYSNSIYFYNYNTLQFIKKITWEKRGPDGILRPEGYYIKNMDSIYVYNTPFTEVVITNGVGKIKGKISLRGTNNTTKWPLYYPQYNTETINLFIETKEKLILTGQYFRSLSDSLIDKFKFCADIDTKTNVVNFNHSYPSKLYGFGYNWEGGLFTQVFPELHPGGDKLIFSFPVSHELYIANLDSDNYKTVYAGSRFAGAISSINYRNPKKTPDEKILAHWNSQDLYAAIIYDKFRNVYYRFFRKGISNATGRKREDKPLKIIILDENLSYLGETEIGTEEDWYWQNSFVTEEGLNIEYIEKDFEEVYLTLKIFNLKKI